MYKQKSKGEKKVTWKSTLKKKFNVQKIEMSAG